MGKKKDKRKKAGKGFKVMSNMDAFGDPLKDLGAVQVKAVALGTWMGPEFNAERDAIRNGVGMLHKLPYMVPAAGNDFMDADFTPEEVAMAFARCHLRLQHLLGAWVSAGFIAEDAPTMRVVRADMRVLAEMHLTMMRELAALGVPEGVKQ